MFIRLALLAAFTALASGCAVFENAPPATSSTWKSAFVGTWEILNEGTEIRLVECTVDGEASTAKFRDCERNETMSFEVRGLESRVGIQVMLRETKSSGWSLLRLVRSEVPGVTFVQTIPYQAIREAVDAGRLAGTSIGYGEGFAFTISSSGAEVSAFLQAYAGEWVKIAEIKAANHALQTTSVTRSGFGRVSVSDRQRRGV
jgi:hypothetical protein